ncbi:DMT family transporter [Carboxylicivirga linearis]|uniref:DMT family transporter n=1 Tax=Carboxylicivirga linearis TaxID=1628157 RepID=A0ABS5JV28_9BACT|nr:DMT family transporter [Carboxylicivirga linearis]MBS2098727.1 DMT family transporter [Carboxylicivirga linearis]
MPERLKVILSLLLSMICWAISFVWIKQAFESFNPITIVFFRLVISSLMLIIILKLSRRLIPLKREDVRWFFLLGFFEPFLYFMGESNGLKIVSSTMGAVIVSTVPLFAPIADRLFFKSRLSFLNLAGITISFTGVMILIFEKNFSLAAPIEGIALMFMAVFATMGYAIVLKKIPAHYNAVTIITYQNVVGTILFLPFFIVIDWQHVTHTHITTEAVIAVLQLSVFASSLAFIFFTYGMRKIGISKANVFVNMIPVFTAFFAWWILDEEIDLQKLVGIAIVIGGVFISQLKLRKNGNRPK